MKISNPYTDKLNRWSSHSQIARMLEGLPNGGRVLDIGASSGTLARLCDQRGYVMRGIEPNAGWLGIARSTYAELFEGNLEQTPEAFLGGARRRGMRGCFGAPAPARCATHAIG